MYRNIKTGELVEAVQLPDDGTFDGPSAQMIAKAGGIILPRAGGGVNVQWPKGIMVALPGDWMVRKEGVEYRADSRRLFEATYERAEDDKRAG